MKKWQNVKQEKGITLVALIITIIVLVILAAVTINAAFNSGIIDTAVDGAVNYADAQNKEQIAFNDLDGSIQEIVKRIEEYDIGGNSTPRPTATPDTPTQDGSYDEAKGVNTPKVEGTGLIPVYHNGSTWVELTSSSTADEWNNWYDYENKKWANARTKDGSMWVWIPRYEYNINTSSKIISINFLEGTSTSTSSGYTLHPAFGTDINNGGWSSDIAGFWVAKYPAGWQNGTNGTNSIGSNVEYSSATYASSGSNTSYAGSTASGQRMSLPVFKANTYAYNYISVGDAYKLSQTIASSNRYGLRNVDSHLQKNSEWGAVAYLAHSKYGVNGVDSVAQNTTNKGNTPTGVYAVTSPESVTNTSTTQNITGVYDMSGCVWEYTASFYQGGTTSWTTGMPTGSSSKYVTLYTANNKKGDATNETSGWNGDYAYFVTSSYPVFMRGCDCIANSGAGLFAFNNYGGSASSSNGFRAVLVP